MVENINKEDIVSLTGEQWNDILNILDSNRRPHFSSCTARYDGEGDRTKLEGFIAAVNVFKQSLNTEEQEALSCLPLLLEGRARDWWMGVHSSITKWEDAISQLEYAFAPKKPAYIIYDELFRNRQNANTSIDVFISKKRKLLAELPAQRHDEATELDIIYGQLNENILEKVPRNSIKTFAELLEKGRQAENTSRMLPLIKKRRKCGYCSTKGHILEECRKRKSDISDGKCPSRISCKGCGLPGVIRSECAKCKDLEPAAIKPTVKKLGFFAISGRLLNQSSIADSNSS